MCRSPHSSISISTVSAVRSAVTRAGGRAHHRCDRHIDRQSHGDHPGAQVAIGEDAECAVGQPDQRVGHVVLGHPARRRRAPTCPAIDHQHVTVHELGDRPAVGRGRDRRAGRPPTVPRRGRQERQTRRLGELRPHQPRRAAGSVCSARWCAPRTPSRRRSATACSRRSRPVRRCRSWCRRRWPAVSPARADHPDVVGHAGRVVGDDGVSRELDYYRRRPTSSASSSSDIAWNGVCSPRNDARVHV